MAIRAGQIMAGFLEFLGDVAFPTAMQRMRQREAQEQAQQILGQRGTGAAFQGQEMGPQQPVQGTGLLGRQVTPMQAGQQLLKVPGYEQMGLNLLQQFAPKPQGPTEFKTAEVGAGPGLRQRIAFNPMNPQEFQPLGQPYSVGGSEKGSSPLGKEAAMWINQAGEAASPTMTLYEATERGYIPKTSEQMKSIQAGKEFAPLLKQSFKYAFGSPGKQGKYEDSLFPSGPIESFAPLRGIAGLLYGAGATTGISQRASMYDKTSKAMVSNLSRLTGQIGTLTDMDVQRVEGLLPEPGYTPLPEAKERYKMIVSLLSSKGVGKKQLKELGFPDWAFEGDISSNVVDFNNL